MPNIVLPAINLFFLVFKNTNGIRRRPAMRVPSEAGTNKLANPT
jgi:hypothetical protein